MTERPQKEVTIQVTQQEKMKVSTYESETPGLVVHRQVRWSPGKEEHKFTSKWQVTHEPSGRGILTPSRCLPRQKDALKLARRLGGIVEWQNVSADKMAQDDDLLQQVKQVYEGIIREHDEEESGQVVVDEMYENRFWVERDRESGVYKVMDAKSNDIAVDSDGNPMQFSHRGRAWKEAHRLNNAESV